MVKMFDTHSILATFSDGDSTIIRVDKGDMDKAIQVILREMDRIENTRKHKMSLRERMYYHQTYHTDIFQDALDEENIDATVWG